MLVNNVGDMAATQMSWRELTPESVDHTIALDIKGTLLMTHEVGRRMLDDQQSGAIVNIGSRVVVEGSPRAPQYAAAKYAIIGITKSYAHALAPHVRVNTLGPGFVETEALLAREDWQTGRREAVLARTPLARIPTPADVVPPVVFLACDDSTPYHRRVPALRRRAQHGRRLSAAASTQARRSASQSPIVGTVGPSPMCPPGKIRTVFGSPCSRLR